MDRALRVFVIVLCAAALAAIVIGGIWLLKNRYNTSVITTYVASENSRVGNDMAVANETMAVEEVEDHAAVAVQREELKHADIVKPDGLTARQRRGCIILRQQGQDLSRNPTCRSVTK